MPAIHCLFPASKQFPARKGSAVLVFIWMSVVLTGLGEPIAVAQPPGGGFGDRGGFGGRDRSGGREESSGRGGRGERGERGGPGGSGGPGGPGGGFDPSGFLSRLDRNGDGKLSPDEQEGPASFLIRRLESIDSKIKPGATISVKRITEAFEKMRGGGGSGEDRGSRGDRGSDDDRGRSSSRDDDLMEVEPLVPGFGEELPITSVPGFGPSAEVFSVAVTAEDQSQAQEVLGKYDRNKDGQIDEEEVKRGRFWGNPMDFDRNSDKKLSASELATRQAVRRVRESSGESDNRKDSKRDREKSSEPVKQDFEGRRSYRVYAASSPEGMPSFYSERDLDSDGQITMSEYTSDWTDARVVEFYAWDQNGDGVITTSEVQGGVNRGLVASNAPRGTATQSQSNPMPTNAASSNSVQTGTTANSGNTGKPAAEAVSGAQPSEKMMSYARNIIQRNDTNKDGVLTATEWKSMLLSPAAADANGDGRVTITEYAAYRENKRSR